MHGRWTTAGGDYDLGGFEPRRRLRPVRRRSQRRRGLLLRALLLRLRRGRLPVRRRARRGRRRPHELRRVPRPHDRAYWDGCYTSEAFHVAYTGTTSPIPTPTATACATARTTRTTTTSRTWPSSAASRRQRPLRRRSAADTDAPRPPTTRAYGRVNPFNPCLPAPRSRTCRAARLRRTPGAVRRLAELVLAAVVTPQSSSRPRPAHERASVVKEPRRAADGTPMARPPLLPLDRARGARRRLACLARAARLRVQRLRGRGRARVRRARRTATSPASSSCARPTAAR